jgi:aldehyde dehydrogenase (NAD+)
MRIRALSFTGSTRTGRAIQIASANSNLKKVVFELGGKGPAVIFDDADLEEAAKQTEFSINYNSGQTCMANSRVYVQESAKEKFSEIFKRLASERKIGNPRESNINHGPQADKVQYDTVLKYVALGKELGQISLDGGKNSENLTVHPVIFTDAPEDSAIMKEEIFGPVVVINTFSTEEEVIAKANDTKFGLYESLWTRDLERALRVSKKLESGMVSVNYASPTGSWDLPFGGWKQSGTGRESLLESMEHFTEQKSIYFKVNRIGS